MLDENLPAFFLKPATSGIKHHSEFYFTQHGSEPEAAYHIQHADPASPTAAQKNCYAVALFDAYNPDILFGEVLARPEWTTPPPSTAQGGVPPPPQPILPNEFIVQLYNPEQQVRVEVKTSKWSGEHSYEFSMPQDVFRTPSQSNLDRGASDPASLESTPRINFVWRKDGRLNKDLTCFLTGKSTDLKKKSSRKDPDISVALWRQMHELTLYEPNLVRVELEDPKGLEVVLLLTAVVIKDLYFSQKDQLRDLFNISEGPTDPRRPSGGGKKPSNTPIPAALAATDGNASKLFSLPRLQTGPQASNPNALSSNRPPPFPDARTQWELDAETARLKAQQQAESQAAQRRKREQERKDEAERKRLQKMVEDEERAARKKQADIDRETERLRKLYGVTPISNYQQPPPIPGNRPYLSPAPQSYPQRFGQPYASTSNLNTMSGGAGPSSGLGVPSKPSKLKTKRSFWH